MKRLIIYIHGKGGTAEEVIHYQHLFEGSDVIGFDYQSKNPWEAQIEFPHFYDMHSKGYDTVILVANSIGAFFSMSALAEKKISQALFISPIVDMEKLITDMMLWSNVTEEELQSKKRFPQSLERPCLGNICATCESIRLNGIFLPAFYMVEKTI